jgi:hypothetical protein
MVMVVSTSCLAEAEATVSVASVAAETGEAGTVVVVASAGALIEAKASVSVASVAIVVAAAAGAEHDR